MKRGIHGESLNLLVVFLGMLFSIILLMLTVACKDVLVDHLLRALALLSCLNSVRLVSDKKLMTNHNYEKKTNT